MMGYVQTIQRTGLKKYVSDKQPKCRTCYSNIPKYETTREVWKFRLKTRKEVLAFMSDKTDLICGRISYDYPVISCGIDPGVDWNDKRAVYIKLWDGKTYIDDNFCCKKCAIRWGYAWAYYIDSAVNNLQLDGGV